MKIEFLNLIFVHIPRTGGTSIENFFIDWYGINPLKDFIINECLEHFNFEEYVDHFEDLSNIWQKSRDASKYNFGKSHFLKFGHKENRILEIPSFYKHHWFHYFDGAKWLQHASIKDFSNKKDYFKFAFVRNPWDKAVSDWIYLQEQADIKPTEPLKNYLLQEGFFATINHLNNRDGRADHFATQSSFIVENENIAVDFVGKFENLQEDFKTVCDKLGIANPELPHKNKTNRKHYTEYYDDETRQIVAEKYAKDIEYFGYKFGE
mgnify:CR=1 FL=1|tara:strand:- start:3708 stop:4499 length:792 start_codon:yes stop_codon:yes gene_type:complete